MPSGLKLLNRHGITSLSVALGNGDPFGGGSEHGQEARAKAYLVRRAPMTQPGEAIRPRTQIEPEFSGPIHDLDTIAAEGRPIRYGVRAPRALSVPRWSNPIGSG